jgi:predicted negative regulator of RcsB-dependent stress response
VRARGLLIITAIVSSLLGAVVAWLVLTVPNDLQAGAMLKNARKDVEAGHNDKARQELSRIIQQYPRTDAAAAATVALATIADSERHALSASIDMMRKTADAQQKQIASLTARVDTLAAAPAPQPVTVEAAPAPKKKTPVHHTRRKRRR